jgi:asparagine synthase (glutamine-hydrolysing)
LGLLDARIGDLPHRRASSGSTSSHGLVARVAFLDSDVVDYALRIPPELKLRRDDEVTENWILRQALTDVLPDEVLWRCKAQFRRGAGVSDLLAQSPTPR